MAASAISSNSVQAHVSNTIYCSNLPDKLQKDDLKQALYMLFSTYGSILDIVALKTLKMRGQAHVLFRDSQASAAAFDALKNHEFFGKPMKLSYATGKSDTLAKLDGTWKQPESATSQTQAPAAQQSIFAGPPGTTTTSQVPTQPPPSLAPPTRAAPGAASPARASSAASPADASAGDKRLREHADVTKSDKRQKEDTDDEGEAPMEMDDEPMDESEDE